jgi:hypothetical protein
MFDTSGQLVMQTAIGGAGTLFGPLLGAAVWLYLSDFLQTTLHLGAAWKLVLGVVFVLLVCFLRHGLIGGIEDLYGLVAGAMRKSHRPPRRASRLRERKTRLSTNRPPYALSEIDAESTLVSRASERCGRSCRD